MVWSRGMFCSSHVAGKLKRRLADSEALRRTVTYATSLQLAFKYALIRQIA